jgi:hypothetical protein
MDTPTKPRRILRVVQSFGYRICHIQGENILVGRSGRFIQGGQRLHINPGDGNCNVCRNGGQISIFDEVYT